MTIIVKPTGGQNSEIMAAFLIFQNADRSYPIRRIVDDVPGACYRTQPKGWMDKDVFLQWLQEPR